MFFVVEGGTEGAKYLKGNPGVTQMGKLRKWVKQKRLNLVGVS